MSERVFVFEVQKEADGVEQITSKDNPRIRALSRLMTSARDRRAAHLFVAEGERLCRDAALSNAEIVRVFCTADAHEKYADTVRMLAARTAEQYEISPELARRVGDTETPQGLFAVCRMRDQAADAADIAADDCWLVLENIQDPSNMGAIFRSAEAFGLSGVLLAGSCCDVYAPKAVRAGMGAVFRLRLLHAPDGVTAAETLHRAGIRTFAAVAHGDARPLRGGVLGAGCAVFIGNEGNGLRPETAAACRERLTIPMRGRAESLNAAAAAAILTWAMADGAVETEGAR